MQENNLPDGVQRALKLLKEEQSTQQPKEQMPEPQDASSGVQRALRLLEEEHKSGNNESASALNDTNSSNSEYSYGERALQFGRGIAKTYGTIGDIFATDDSQSHPYGQGHGLTSNFDSVDTVPADYVPEKLSKVLPEQVDKVAGRDLTPTDTTGKFLEGTGEFFAPLPIPGLGGAILEAKGAKGVANAITKELLPAAGASAALNATPKLFDEKSPAGFAEDLVKTIIGTKAGIKAAGRAELIAKRLENLVKTEGVGMAAKESFNAIKDIPKNVAAKVGSIGSAPKKEILDLAKKYDIDLPFNVGTDGRWQNFAANNVFSKSIFTSKTYETVLKNADEKMIKVVDDAIESLGDSTLKPTEASLQYKDFLKEESKTLKNKANEMYDKADSLLLKEDKVVPSNTETTIKDIIQKLEKADFKSSDTQATYKILDEIGRKWGIIQDIPAQTPGTGYNPTKLIEAIKSLKSDKPIEVERLLAVKSELMKAYDHDPAVTGSKALLKGAVSAIEKDIKSSKNEAFTTARKEADAFYKLQIKERVQSDIAKAIMHGEAPELAYSYMTDIPNIDLIEKVAGQSENGKKVFNALKKAKTREILSKSFENDGSLKTGNFASTFKKESGQELIERLVGKEEYTKLKDIAEISAEYSRSGKQLLNTSGTALTGSELGKVEAILGGVSGLFGIAGNAATLIPGVSYAATVNAGSRLLADPKFVDQMHKYAMAAQAGKQKDATTLLKRLSRMIDEETATKSAKYTITDNVVKSN